MGDKDFLARSKWYSNEADVVVVVGTGACGSWGAGTGATPIPAAAAATAGWAINRVRKGVGERQGEGARIIVLYNACIRRIPARDLLGPSNRPSTMSSGSLLKTHHAQISLWRVSVVLGITKERVMAVEFETAR
jgi:hypothetical protein